MSDCVATRQGDCVLAHFSRPCRAGLASALLENNNHVAQHPTNSSQAPAWRYDQAIWSGFAPRPSQGDPTNAVDKSISALMDYRERLPEAEGELVFFAAGELMATPMEVLELRDWTQAPIDQAIKNVLRELLGLDRQKIDVGGTGQPALAGR